MSQHRATWRIPKLLLYRVATPGRRVMWNEYSSCGRIGAFVVLRSWCLSLVWKRG